MAAFLLGDDEAYLAGAATVEMMDGSIKANSTIAAGTGAVQTAVAEFCTTQCFDSLKHALYAQGSVA